MRVGDLVMSLRHFRAPNVFNPWGEVDPLDRFRAFGAIDRRTRLFQHFDCKAEYLLVGEAPGYQGCRFSGVPFTNEKLILDGAIPRVTSSGRITKRIGPWSEPSATIVWRTLHALKIAEHTVMWNAFAFHPFKPDEPYSNRAPTPQELKAAAPHLLAVLAHFKGARVITIGRVAERALACAVGIREADRLPGGSVRHPSMGGAREFETQLRELVTRYNEARIVEQADVDEGQP